MFETITLETKITLIRNEAIRVLRSKNLTVQVDSEGGISMYLSALGLTGYYATIPMVELEYQANNMSDEEALELWTETLERTARS